MATVDDKKVIFSMVGVSKIIPQNRKQILKDIYLSFFYGAKIGIIGLNGAGKSTLMKIVAGLEQPTSGEVVWSPGYTVGYLPQDPPLDETKTVKENVMEGVKQAYDALKEYEEINAKFGLEEYYGDPDKMDRLMQRQAEVQDIIDATAAWPPRRAYQPPRRREHRLVGAALAAVRGNGHRRYARPLLP